MGYQLQGNVEDCFHALWVGFPHFPRLAFSDIFVSDACQVHCFFLCIAEFEYVEHTFYLFFYVFQLVKGLFVYFKQRSAGGNNAIKVFLGEL